MWNPRNVKNFQNSAFGLALSTFYGIDILESDCIRHLLHMRGVLRPLYVRANPTADFVFR